MREKRQKSQKQKEKELLFKKLTNGLKRTTNIELINDMSPEEKGLILKGGGETWGRISQTKTNNGKLQLQFFEPMGRDVSKIIEITVKEAAQLIKTLFKNPIYK